MKMEDGYCDSRGEDDNNGGNGIDDNGSDGGGEGKGGGNGYSKGNDNSRSNGGTRDYGNGGCNGALRATVLVIVVVAAAMKMVAMAVEARRTERVPLALVMITLAAIDIAHFVAHHLIAYAIARVVAIDITFVGGQQRVQGQGWQERWQQ